MQNTYIQKGDGMKILGVLPSSDNVVWSLIEGDKKTSVIQATTPDRQKLPKTKKEEENLANLQLFLGSFLKEVAPDRVCILTAGSTQYGNSSKMRVKIEGVFQLVCYHSNIPVVILKTQLKTQHTKFQKDMKTTLEVAVNEGEKFSSEAKKNAALIAWLGF